MTKKSKKGSKKVKPTANVQAADTNSKPKQKKTSGITAQNVEPSKPESSEQLPYLPADFDNVKPAEAFAGIANALSTTIKNQTILSDRLDKVIEVIQVTKVTSPNPTGSSGPNPPGDLGDLTKLLDHPVASKFVEAGAKFLENLDLAKILSPQPTGPFDFLNEKMQQDVAGLVKSYYEKANRTLDAFLTAVEKGQIKYETETEE